MAEYIEREAARPDAFCEGVSCQECPFMKDHINGGCRVDDHIMSLFAADVAPVRHAQWIKADSNPLHGDFFCSDCQHGVDIGDGEETPIDRGFYYCHNCGAKMDGGKT